MHLLLFFFLLVAFPLFADPKGPYSLAVTEGEPAALVEGCVSAITGDLYLEETDAVVQGYVPLRLPRQYLSGNGKGALASWSFLNQVIYDYDGQDRLKSIRTTSPNLHHTYASATFHYRHRRKEKVPDVDISLSDGRTLRYRYQGKEQGLFFLLKSVTFPDSPEETLFYYPRHGHTGNLVSRITQPLLRFHDIDYYREGRNDVGGTPVKLKDRHDPRYLRVKTLKAPIGTDETPHGTHRFFYELNQRYTDVRDIDNTLTRYHYSQAMRLERIESFGRQDALNHIESFAWSDSGDNGMNII